MSPKKIYPIITILIIIFVLSFVYFLVSKKQTEKSSLTPPKEKTMTEILQDLTASSTGEQSKVSAETIKSLTAPKNTEASEDVLKGLTAPQQ